MSQKVLIDISHTRSVIRQASLLNFRTHFLHNVFHFCHPKFIHRPILERMSAWNWRNQYHFDTNEIIFFNINASLLEKKKILRKHIVEYYQQGLFKIFLENELLLGLINFLFLEALLLGKLLEFVKLVLKINYLWVDQMIYLFILSWL